MTRVLLVFLGGGFGSALRYAVGAALPQQGPFPLGTWTVNVVGSFVIALCFALPAFEADAAPEARLLVTTGVIGGFTTYSAFNAELVARVQRGESTAAALYALATLVACFGAGLLGSWVGRILRGASA